MEDSEKLHSFRKVEQSGRTAVLDRKDMPWLPKEQQVAAVNLVLVTRMDGQQFFLGNSVKGDLIRLAAMLTDQESDQANKIFYAGVEEFLNNPGLYRHRVDNNRSQRKTYYAKNGDGSRVYFIPVDQINSKPVIIRIAVCNSKDKEKEVYRSISTEKTADIRRRLFR